MAAVALQLGPGQVHVSAPYVVHRIDDDLTKVTIVLVSWRETPIGLFDAVEKVHVQRRSWNAELDDNLSAFNGVTGSALTCCGGDGLAGYLLGQCVALLLRDRSILLEKPLYLILSQGGDI